MQNIFFLYFTIWGPIIGLKIRDPKRWPSELMLGTALEPGFKLWYKKRKDISDMAIYILADIRR